MVYKKTGFLLLQSFQIGRGGRHQSNKQKINIKWQLRKMLHMKDVSGFGLERSGDSSSGSVFSRRERNE